MKRHIPLPLIALMFVLVPLGIEAWEMGASWMKMLHAVAALFTFHFAGVVPAICAGIAVVGLLVVLAAFVWESK